MCKRALTREEWLAQFQNRTPKPPPPVEICGIVLNPETDETVGPEHMSYFGNRACVKRTPDGHQYSFWNGYEIRITINGELWFAHFSDRWHAGKQTRRKVTT